MIGLLFAVTGATLAQADTTPHLVPLLERVAAYVESYERELGTLVCHERYEQKLRRGGRIRRTRILASDFFLLSFPDRVSLGFRDVAEIDGRPLRNRAKRLRHLFETGGAVDPRAALRESARHNIGQIYRTVNSPTFPLKYLQRSHWTTVEFAIDGTRLSDGRLIVQLRYVDSAPDTLVHNNSGDPVPAEGVALVDAETGRVLQMRLLLREARAQVRAQVGVRFAPDERLALWVPAEMQETYWHDTSTPQSEVVECTATYGEFSRVVVDTREWFQVRK